MKHFSDTCRGRFARNEDGAITVDWIVLTAALVMLGMAAAFTVGSSVPEVADKVSDRMRETDVNPYD